MGGWGVRPEMLILLIWLGGVGGQRQMLMINTCIDKYNAEYNEANYGTEQRLYQMQKASMLSAVQFLLVTTFMVITMVGSSSLVLCMHGKC